MSQRIDLLNQEEENTDDYKEMEEVKIHFRRHNVNKLKMILIYLSSIIVQILHK